MASFRLAVLGTLFSIIAAIIVFALIYAANRIAAREELSPIVAGDRADLLSDAAADNRLLVDEIMQAINQAPNHTYYILLDPHGKILFANIPLPAEPTDWSSITRFMDPKMPEGVERIDGIGSSLSDGSFLFVGEDASVFAALNRRVAIIFAVVFSGMIGLGLLASLLIAAYSLKRVRAISEASAAITTGDLSRRIEAYGIDDELDVLTEDLNRMLEMIEHLVETARQVTNDIAHDLRSPLVRLHDWLQYLQRFASVRDDEKLSSGLDAALTQADMILSIFSAILRLAEIEVGALRGGFKPLDLTLLVQEIGDEFSQVAADARQSLTFSAQDGIWINGDLALLTQMAVNLIENAISHCPAGTIIRLALMRLENVIRLEIADNGSGIPEAERERVFRRFVRLEQSRHTSGHGLGLPLVRAIARLHDAEIALLDNHPGLSVRIDFPVQDIRAGHPERIDCHHADLS